VFGAILDDRRGGRFRIGPNEPDAIPKQLYLPDTNVLITRFLAVCPESQVCSGAPKQKTCFSNFNCRWRRCAGAWMTTSTIR
jgi:hypothetical protein